MVSYIRWLFRIQCARENASLLKANGYYTTFSIDVDVNKCLTEFVLSVSLRAGDYPSTIRIIPPPLYATDHGHVVYQVQPSIYFCLAALWPF